jgi:6-phosphogluconolactonase (cycloisomerase 2 family)
VVDPTGRFLYVIDETAGTVNGFTISQIDSTLTTAGGVTGLDTPTDVLVDHQGHYLYVIDGPTVGAGAILAYSIDQTSGALTPLGTPSYPVGNQPIFGTIESSDPTKPHIYVPNGGDSTVSGYSIAPATGLLTQIGASAFPIPGATANTFLDNAIVDPTGKFLYVIDYEILTGDVYTFNIGAGGVIGTQVGSLVPTGDGPGGMVIDPTGKLLAIDNNVDNNISFYSITGRVLTSETPKATGSAPFGIVFSIGPGL